MDNIEKIIPTVLMGAAEKFVQAEKELSRHRNERFRSRVLRIIRRAANRHIFFGVCIIVVFVTFLLLKRSKNAS